MLSEVRTLKTLMLSCFRHSRFIVSAIVSGEKEGKLLLQKYLNWLRYCDTVDSFSIHQKIE